MWSYVSVIDCNENEREEKIVAVVAVAFFKGFTDLTEI